MIQLFKERYAQRKAYHTGTHRSRSPEQTVDDYSRFMQPLGITRLANVTGLDCIGIPVCIAIRPNSRSLAVSQGKGVDVHAARASALMESIELWHAENIANPLRFESYDVLRRGAHVVNPLELPLRVEERPQLDRPMLWIEGWELVESRPIWVPFEPLNMNTVRPPGTRLSFHINTNGLASGNHLLEAIEHALCEVLERDAVALTALEGAAGFTARKLDEASVSDPDCRALLEKLRDAGLSVAMADLTAHAGVPTFQVGILDAEDRPRWRRLGAFWGYGTHLSAEVALARALTEAAQSRLTIIAGSRDDNPHAVYAAMGSDEGLARERDARFRPEPRLEMTSAPSRATDSFEGDIAVLVEAVRRLGLEQVIVVDLRRAEIGIPVVKVIVPGSALRSEGVPVALGPRARARLEQHVR